jgi:hypothetical protein
MDKKTLDEYSQPIQHTIDYLEGKRKRASRKNWTEDQRKKWSLRHRSCPICGDAWTKNNPMTKEHIHPLVLGGFERDENIIPLCDKCNKARNDVMIAVLGSSDIRSIKKRMPAIKVPIQEFVVWCHATISKDMSALSQSKELCEAFSEKRKIPNPFLPHESPTTEPQKDSFFERMKRPFRSILQKAKSSPKNESKNKSVEFNQADDKDHRKEIHSKSSKQTIGDEVKIDDPKFDLDNWLLENWEGFVSFGSLTQALIAFDKEHRGKKKRTARRILEEDFGLEKRSVSQHFLSLNSTTTRISPDGGDLDVGSDVKIATYLRNSINKRIPTKTYKSGFSASQLGYIFKQAKEHFEVSWNELFSSFDVTGTTIQEKSISVVSQLGFTLEEEIGSDEILRYKITEKIGNRNTQKRPPSTRVKSASKTKFPLIQWLNENWKGSESYTKLCAEILAYEQNSGGKRKAKDVLKNDFGIPKSISKEKKVARIEKMISLNKTLNPGDFKEIITSILGDDEVPMSKLAEEFRKAAVARGAPDSTTGKMLKEFGFDGKIRTVLEDLFGSELVIGNDSSNPKVKLRLVRKNDLLVETGGSFPLHSWLESNWEGKASYPSLRKAITEFESKKGNPRKFRDVVKQDFDIPKGWNVKRIVKKMNELKPSSDL